MKKLLIFSLLVCLGGCEPQEKPANLAIKTERNKNGIRKICLDGYVFVEKTITGTYGHGAGITQFFEYVDGVTRPKMCGGGE